MNLLMRALRGFLIGCILGALCGFAVAQTQPQIDPNIALRQAVQLVREHHYTEAEAALKSVAAPSNPEQKIAFYRLKAAVASGLEHYGAAAQYMETAARLAPKDQDLHVAAGIARLQEQIANHANPTEALRRLRGEMFAAQQNIAVRLQMAEILSRGGLFAAAATDFAAASALAPDRPDLIYDVALANFRAGRLSEALTTAERAKNLEDSGSIESLLGDIQEKQGNALAAVHSYQAAVNLEPGEERYRVALAVELLRHQTFDAASVVLTQAAELFAKSIHIKILLGLNYYFVDRSADAIRTLLEATKLDGEDETAAHYLGEIVLQDTSEPDPEATGQVCKFADQHPQDKIADAFCGGILLRLAGDSGDSARQPEILRRLRHATRIAPKESVARCQLGKALEAAEEWKEAQVEMEACVRLDPNSPDGHYQLARIYRRLGLTQSAERQTTLQKAAALHQSEESVRRTEFIEKFRTLINP